MGVAASCTCQDIWKAAATRPKASRTREASLPPRLNRTRMKKRPVSGSSNCWLSRMLADSCTRKLLTA